MTTHDKLIHAVVEYDRRQERKLGYNRYALAQYVRRVQEITADIERGAEPREAILRGFMGPLANACLRAIDESKQTHSEAQRENWRVCYEPVVESKHGCPACGEPCECVAAPQCVHCAPKPQDSRLGSPLPRQSFPKEA